MQVDGSIPPPKRARLEKESSKIREPRLFAPFRALGLVTNHVPFVLQTRSHKGATEGPRIHILTCLGRSWALWEGGKMTLLFAGADAPEQISSMAMDGDAVWTSAGCCVMKYLRGKEVLRFTNPLGTTLSFITIFGSRLLALTEEGSRMMIWDTAEEEKEPLSTIHFDVGFTATGVLHPATYLNKVLISSSEGDMQLWNIQTKSCIHKFSANTLRPTRNSVDRLAAITALVQSPAIDVVGIGFSSGEILVYDIRNDERILRMFMEGGGVRTLGFRGDGEPILASASSAGHIALWDLNSGGQLLHVVRGAHDGAVTAIEWVPGQPLLVSSGEDNSIKQWLFESPTSPPRLLKFRSGHHAPPHLIRYFGEDGKQLLTASRDRSLRCTSVVRDSRSFEMSQGSFAKKATTLSISVASLKFPPITSISHCSARSKDWDDIMTAHMDETFARTWSMQNKKLGKHNMGFTAETKLKAKSTPTTGSVRAVCVTACGNFGIAGSSNGAIELWNMQSGIKRKTFTLPPCPVEVLARSASNKKRNIERPVSGLATDSLNTCLIASTLDGTVNFFNFQTTKLEQTLVLPSSAVSVQLHRDSGLLAVVCDDMVVRIVDIETRKIVREMSGFRGRVLDIAFSPDSRWLITTSLDSIIRTFDIPTSCLIDAFRTSSVATSIAFSPTNDFLATAHVDSVGVFLWANRAQYAEISFRSITEDEIFETGLPSVQGTSEDAALEALSTLTVQDKSTAVYSTPLQLDGELITLTLLPRSRWQTLLNFDVIQQRNKPKEPPKAPEKAPFFLPTLPGVESRFNVSVLDEKKEKEKKSRRLDKIAAQSESVFQTKLVEDSAQGNYEAFFNFAKTLSPAAIDLEIRSLVRLEDLRLFMNALKRRLISRRDFEAVQAFQSVFLRLHAEIIVANDELLEDLESLKEVQQSESERVLELIAASLGTLGFIKDNI